MITPDYIAHIVSLALEEDAPWGDLTTENLVPRPARANAELVAREPGVLAGAEVIAEVFAATDPDSRVEVFLDDGGSFEADTAIARIEGSAWGVLRAERVALNIVQRMCATATMTRRFVEAVEGTGARIVDTRKTTPGLRVLEKYAVTCGGGQGHRFSLSDAVLVKDNHLATIARQGIDVTAALQELRGRIPFTSHIEVEVDRLDQIEPVLASGVVDSLQVDNFSLDNTRTAVQLIAGRALVHASGGMTLDRVRSVAETGVDLISAGALTHSAPAIDLALDIDVEG